MHPLCWVSTGGLSSSSIVGLEEPYTNSALNSGRGSTSFWGGFSSAGVMLGDGGGGLVTEWYYPRDLDRRQN